MTPERSPSPAKQATAPESPPAPVEATPRERPLDSPWFWICLFASVAAVALVAIGPKYRQREARLESTFQMREHLARRNAGEVEAAGSDENDLDSSTAEEGGELLKTTGPLIWILLAVAAGSCAMLMRTKVVKPNA
ncbi:MAG: hypothetical protein DCC68_18130 [Planctomycetota bacterium]|nr:MAG: hypothetical protein DCC68_18130 [Planctomycetota bacterium]